MAKNKSPMPCFYSDRNLALSALKEERVLVLGLGRAGRAVSGFLTKSGAVVYASDDNEQVWNEPAIKKLSEAGLKRWRHQKVDLVVVSPGVPEVHPVVQFFNKHNVPIVDELDFASCFLPGTVIAVTGTNGKSTTTALIATMLKSDKKQVFLGGNIAPGKPLSTALSMRPKEFYCVEVSSFQLERANYLAPRIAVVLNVSPDHLDRHQTLKSYIEAKARIFARQRENDWAILNYDDPRVRSMIKHCTATKLFFSSVNQVNGTFLSGGWIYFNNEPVAPVKEIRIPGKHNVENALAAVCVARILGVSSKAIRLALRTFRGLEHRLELVKRVNGVLYVNNSMCTNPQAGVRSIEAFRKKVILIAGGKEKGTKADDYLKAMSRHAKWVVLLGENSTMLALKLARLGFKRFEFARTMHDAVRLASARAANGDIVLFSPGFASFDMFRNFQERGKAFKNEVGKLGKA
jgi:UDP-N-acetylmuramoylalanine--D-glutamate ligase